MDDRDNSLYYRMIHNREEFEKLKAQSAAMWRDSAIKEAKELKPASELDLTEDDKRWLKGLRICV